jgi:hypothetical protein
MIMMSDGEPDLFPAELCTLYVVAEGAELERKLRAMLCMESQVGPLLALGGLDTYRELLAEEAYTDVRPG